MTAQVVVDWTKLSPDLVRLITKKIKKFDNISNFFHFRSVCKAWRSVSCLVRPFPWILAHHESLVEFYSLSTGKTNTITFPELAPRNIDLHEPIRGWVDLSPDELVDGANDGAMLIKILAWYELLVPFGEANAHDPNKWNLVKNSDQAVWWSVDRDSIPYKRLYVWPDDKKDWTMQICIPSTTWAIVYWRHKFLLLTGNKSRITVIDETRDHIEWLPARELLSKSIWLPARDIECLIPVGDGSLLAVRHNFAAPKREKFWFEIFQLENDYGTHWTKLSEIGDLMLFLDSNGGYSLKASDFDGFKGNCIYFITRVQEGGEIKFGLHRYDMRRKKTETIPWPAGLGKDAKRVSWFVPAFY